jgi:formamidopyrimidine-DNA glycosylase
VSIEMPEATILTRQLQAALAGKSVAGYALKDAAKLQQAGFFNKDSAALEWLVGRAVEAAVCRGNTMLLEFTGDERLIIFPEYGGEVLFRKPGGPLPEKYHFRLDFSDGSALTVRINSIGGVHALDAAALAEHYIYRRDFDPQKFSPDAPELTAERFAELLAAALRQLKTVIVGKDAFVVGLSNAAFQDIIFRAGLHPKRRGADLTGAEAGALYGALRLVVSERMRLGGKAGFRDLHGEPGRYEAAMGPGMKGRACPRCGTAVQKIAHGGGEVFVCPGCQV